jgi:hypothetical protein
LVFYIILKWQESGKSEKTLTICITLTYRMLLSDQLKAKYSIL